MVGAERGAVIAAARAGWGLAVAAALGCAAGGPEQRDPPADPGAPAGDATEAAIARAVDAGNPAALALLERIVDINSGTMNLAGVREVGRVLRAELDALGFTTRWVDGAAFGRAGHLIAEHRAAGPHLLLIGHLDTVFELASPFQRFERLSDTAARGPGVCDMKGGDVIIVHALRALKAVGALDRLAITVVMTGDEEHPGEPLAEARRALVDAAAGAAAAIGFEDGAGDPKLANIARRGATAWTLRSTGTPAHSSQIFRDDVGPGAIFEAARVLEAFRVRLAGQPYLTFNPGVVLGGGAVTLDAPHNQGSAAGKLNVVSKEVVVQGDLRTLSPEQLAQAQGTMREIVGQPLPHTTSAIEFDVGYPPMAPTDGNRQLLALYDAISRELGLGPVTAVDPLKTGAADVSFVAARVPMALDGIGLSGADDHTDKETADLRMLPAQTKRAAVLVYRLTRRLSQRPTQRP
ncbi:MAG TPA: M20/M25/M40 family metallo-hydrolase [Kofleriaceae bacterium]|nr:M20/M25/M40 family metallo-hydrolase [Kofleriaceae bacterium]